MSDFRNLKVWQKSMSLVRMVYCLTEKLPNEERFGLASQIRRCFVSIPSNIAEGSKRSTDKDYKNFLRISSGSIAELETQLLIVEDIFNIKDGELNNCLKEVQKMLEAFIKKL